MSRPLRIQYPGAFYHLACRGNEKKEIFRDDEDRATFLAILRSSQKCTGEGICLGIDEKPFLSELLYRKGGLKGEEIGKIFEVSY